MKRAKELMLKNWGLALVIFTLLVYILLKGLLPEQNWLDMTFFSLILFEMVYLVYLEIKQGVKKSGWKHEVVDTLIAIVIALFIWFGAQFVLGTSTPISAVVSCSMLPELYRGDFVVVQGGEITVPEAEITEGEFYKIVNGPFVVRGNGMEKTYGKPFHTYCRCNPGDEFCTLFYTSEEEFTETAGPVTYHYKWCSVNYAAGESGGSMRCLDYLEIDGEKFEMANESNDIVVYAPKSTDAYGSIGDIVHRTVVRLNVNGEIYYLTGGDNNPVLDNQVYRCDTGAENEPVPESSIRGKVIGRIPYLGYLKLVISPHWQEDEQCSWTLER